MPGRVGSGIMASGTRNPRLGRLPRQLAGLSARAGRWWLRQFLDLVPELIGKWLVGPGRGILVLESDEEVLRLKLLDDTRKELASTQIRASDYSSASIDDFLQSHGFTRDGVDIGIRLSSEKIFA